MLFTVYRVESHIINLIEKAGKRWMRETWKEKESIPGKSTVGIKPGYTSVPQTPGTES